MTIPPPAQPVPASMTARAPASVAALIAFVIVVVHSLLYFITKLIAVAVTTAEAQEQIAVVFGVLGILSLLPPIAAVVLAHIGLAQTRDGKWRGRVIAAVALGLGYLHIGMWLNRITIAIIVAAQAGDPSAIVPNIFWWA